MVHDSKLCIAAFLVADVYLCRRLGLPNTPQIVFHSKRGLQRGDILVHRTIQAIGHCVQSYSLHSFVDRRINWTLLRPLDLRPRGTTEDRRVRLNTKYYRLTTNWPKAKTEKICKKILYKRNNRVTTTSEEGNNMTDENVVGPDVLYKYYAFNEYTEKIFTFNEIYFSSPNEFNDPFDSKLHLNYDGTLKERKRYLCKLYQKKYPKLSKEEILTDVEMEIIAKGRVEIVLKEAIEKARELLRKKLGICCFTEIKDNILMWAHYAKQHTGFCLEFDVNNNFFRPSTQAIKIEYSEFRPELNVLQLDSYPKRKLGEALLIKANNWQYEQEWRSVDYENGKGTQNFPEDALRGVILGCRISQENKENVFRWCRERKHSPSLYEAREKQKEFGLDIVRVNY